MNIPHGFVGEEGIATTVDVREFGSEKADGWAGDPLRFLWLGFGALALLFSGGGWDIALAPWIASAFLLRFTRTSTVATGTTAVWLVSVGPFWAGPFNSTRR